MLAGDSCRELYISYAPPPLDAIPWRRDYGFRTMRHSYINCFIENAYLRFLGCWMAYMKFLVLKSNILCIKYYFMTF